MGAGVLLQMLTDQAGPCWTPRATGFPGTSHVRPEAPLLVTSQGSKRTRSGQNKTSLSVLSKKGFFQKGKQVPNSL